MASRSATSGVAVSRLSMPRMAPLCSGCRCLVLCMQLERLSISGEEHMGAWAVGIDTIPQAWSRLTALTSLELRGHQAS